MDGVNEPDENGKISNLLDPDARKTNLWTKVAKLAKPQRRKRHFTLERINKLFIVKRGNLLRDDKTNVSPTEHSWFSTFLGTIITFLPP
ncbi:hypothetical protein Hanom_Chr04g00281011 [Helianthus anomalus]